MKKPKLSFYVFTILLLLVGCGQKEINTEEPSNKQNKMVTRDEIKEGDFIYRLVTEKATYVKNEPIKLYAELEYIGTEEQINISHAASPFYFPIVEKTRKYDIGYNMNEPLITTTIKKGEPLREEYRGSGGYGSEDEIDYIRFMKRIMNGEFPEGIYEVKGIADFFVSSKDSTTGSKDYKLETNIELKVVEEN